MIVIDNTIVSENIIKVNFCCDMKKCKGACCIEGDAGAPLEMEEIAILEDIFESIEPYMTKKGIEEIKKTGMFDYDSDGNFVTPLINNKECAYACFNSDEAGCAIENAFNDGKIDFQKPVSCHLYPVRITKYKDYDAVNYHEWIICKQGLRKGKKLNLPLYKFLKKPLIRKFGKEWFNKLEKEINVQIKK